MAYFILSILLIVFVTLYIERVWRYYQLEVRYTKLENEKRTN